MSEFKSNETAATAVEYGLIAGIIGMSVVAGALATGEGIVEIFTSVDKVVPEIKKGD